jgi:hypothetical protein
VALLRSGLVASLRGRLVRTGWRAKTGALLLKMGSYGYRSYFY